MDFADTLLGGCPPSSAKEVDSALDVFRIVVSDPPTAKDFMSHWILYPEKRPKWPECTAKAVSVLANHQSCEHLIKLPSMKSGMVCKLNLPPGCGMIHAKGTRGHISWWLACGFDPLPHCEMKKAV